MTLNKKKISALLSFGIILGSLFVTALLFIVSFQYYAHLMEIRKNDRNYHAAAVIQTGYEIEPLMTAYLIELMGLSIDKPANLYAVNAKELQKKLLGSPLIKSAEVNKVFPNILYVDYEARKPIAYLKDFSNTLISEDGFLLPFKPFFSPKKFPQIYLGPKIYPPNDQIYGTRIDAETMRLVLDFIMYTQNFFNARKESVHFIDFSNLNDESKEHSEIILLISALNFNYLLRLGAYSYKENFSLFDPIMTNEKKRLQKYLPDQIKEYNIVIDLRIPGMGLVTP